LNFTKWAPHLTITPLMEFVTNIGSFLFSYPAIKNGDILDYTYFWGGRSSCKRTFLIEYGIFNPVFRFGCEDIELGYRLSLHGFKVVYNSRAESQMIRSFTFDDFCQRLIKQGRSQYIFSTLHNDSGVHQWAEITGAEGTWNKIKNFYDVKIRSARELDRIAHVKLKYNFELDDLTRRLLHRAYWWAFKACKIKGIIEAKKESLEKAHGDKSKETLYGALEPLLNENKHYTEACIQKQKGYQSQLVIAKISSGGEYRKYVSNMASDYLKREHYERSFLKDSKPFSVEGYCYICQKAVKFYVDYLYSYEIDGVLMPNWRESLICPLCGLNNRMRASIHLFKQVLNPSPESKIYISEQTTPLYQWFVNNYVNVTGSEYLGKGTTHGQMNARGIRNEDMTCLSFADSQFDFILSFDVFEHVPDFQRAFQECFRVLKHNGKIFFTVPFEVNSEKNIIRAIKKENNDIEHLLPPEYHVDPINSRGCLAFYRFGWEMLSQLRQSGFGHVHAYVYWSKEFGYLGGEQFVFVAGKNT
jgi:hypothetical protein